MASELESRVGEGRAGGPHRLSRRGAGHQAVWYRRVSLYVAPSRNEGFGLTPLEAMASQTAVVASDAGAYAEMIVPGVTGAVVPAGDGDALTEAIRRYLADPALAKTHGANALAHVTARFPLQREAAGIAPSMTRSGRGMHEDRGLHHPSRAALTDGRKPRPGGQTAAAGAYSRCGGWAGMSDEEIERSIAGISIARAIHSNCARPKSAASCRTAKPGRRSSTGVDAGLIVEDDVDPDDGLFGQALIAGYGPDPARRLHPLACAADTEKGRRWPKAAGVTLSSRRCRARHADAIRRAGCGAEFSRRPNVRPAGRHDDPDAGVDEGAHGVGRSGR